MDPSIRRLTADDQLAAVRAAISLVAAHEDVHVDPRFVQARSQEEFDRLGTALINGLVGVAGSFAQLAANLRGVSRTEVLDEHLTLFVAEMTRPGEPT
jgi:hypothetical protein